MSRKNTYILIASIFTMLFFNIIDSKGNSFENKNDTTIKNIDLSSNLEKARSEYIEGKKPVYINGILLINKEFGIPYNFTNDIDNETYTQYKKMKQAALEDGIKLNVISGFRSTEVQTQIYNNFVARDGIEKASRYSAKPGHSEHEAGLAFDFTTEDTSRQAGDWFTDTPQSKWLFENAYKYGFILRYPPGKEDITGYKYESWHYRYIGEEHSKNFNMNNLTLEEYLKVVSK